MALRERVGREASPSAAVIDSQSLKPAERGRHRRPGGLRRRQEGERPQNPRLVDTRVIVHSAAIQDRHGAGLVLDKIRRRFPGLELVWADNGYNAWHVDGR